MLVRDFTDTALKLIKYAEMADKPVNSVFVKPDRLQVDFGDLVIILTPLEELFKVKFVDPKLGVSTQTTNFRSLQALELTVQDMLFK